MKSQTTYNEIFCTKIHSNKWSGRIIGSGTLQIKFVKDIVFPRKLILTFPIWLCCPPLENRQMSLALIYEATQRLRITVIIAIFLSVKGKHIPGGIEI